MSSTCQSYIAFISEIWDHFLLPCYFISPGLFHFLWQSLNEKMEFLKAWHGTQTVFMHLPVTESNHMWFYWNKNESQKEKENCPWSEKDHMYCLVFMYYQLKWIFQKYKSKVSPLHSVFYIGSFSSKSGAWMLGETLVLPDYPDSNAYFEFSLVYLMLNIASVFDCTP